MGCLNSSSSTDFREPESALLRLKLYLRKIAKQPLRAAHPLKPQDSITKMLPIHHRKRPEASMAASPRRFLADLCAFAALRLCVMLPSLIMK